LRVTRWTSLVLLVAFASIHAAPGQQRKAAAPSTPQMMRLCLQDPADCSILYRAGDHYVAASEGKTKLIADFWIRSWTAGRVELYGKTLEAFADGYPAEGTFTGRMAADGLSVLDGSDAWKIGPAMSGTRSFTLTWTRGTGPLNITEAKAGSAAGVPPPKQMHVCMKFCENLTLMGDHYDGVLDGETKVSDQFDIVEWGGDVRFVSISKTKEGEEVEIDYLGSIASSGDQIDTGEVFEFGVQPSPFRATWGSARSAGDLPAGHRSKTHPNIYLPEGASEKYASYDDHLRAELMPAHRFPDKWGSWSYDARRPCGDAAATTDPDLAVEIAKYAYRADEIERGNCWAAQAVELHSAEGEMLIGLGWFLGWQGKVDTVRGCRAMQAIGTRDVWAMVILRDCYHSSDDPAFPKDGAQEEKISQWLDAHGSGELWRIDSDDLEMQRQAERQKLIDNPPMTQICRGLSQSEISIRRSEDPGFSGTQTCHDVVNGFELNDELKAIDDKFNAIQ
jgi:hypothetical protein